MCVQQIASWMLFSFDCTEGKIKGKKQLICLWYIDTAHAWLTQVNAKQDGGRWRRRYSSIYLPAFHSLFLCLADGSCLHGSHYMHFTQLIFFNLKMLNMTHGHADSSLMQYHLKLRLSSFLSKISFLFYAGVTIYKYTTWLKYSLLTLSSIYILIFLFSEIIINM